MTVTMPNTAMDVTQWSGQAAIAALPSLLLPKCFACLHIYAWLSTWVFGTQVELCGDPGLSLSAVIAELAIVFTFLMAARWIGCGIGDALMPCSQHCRFYAQTT